MLKQNGCLRGTQEQFNRRDFIRVGSLGFLGINLSQALRLEAAFKQINEKSEIYNSNIFSWYVDSFCEKFS